MMPELIDMDTPVTAAEEKRLQALEEIVTTNFQAFVSVGMALMEIRDSKLYRGTHSTFESYCKARFDVAKSYAYYQIDAFSVMKNLSTMVDKNNEQIFPLLPQNERQVRPLTSLEPEEQAKVWDAVVLDARAQGKKVTASLVKRTVDEFRGEKGRKTLEKSQRDVAQTEFASQEFKDSFEAFLKQIEIAREEGWENTARITVLRHLDAVRKLIGEDGSKVLEDYGYRVTGPDRDKLLAAGYRFFRKNMKQLRVEILKGETVGWEHHRKYHTEEELLQAFERLLEVPTHLQGE